MATSTPPPDSNALMFPAFLYGDHASCRRKMRAEAKKWAKHFDKHGTFPEPKLIPVPPGSTIFMGDQNEVHLMNMGMKFDMTLPPGTAPKEYVFGKRPSRDTPHWFFYLAQEIRWTLSPKITDDGAKRRAMNAAYEAFACRYPWGALSEAINHNRYNTIPTVSHRLEALLSCWDKLDSVRYLDVIRRLTTLTGLATFHCQGPVTMWVDAPTGDIRKDLRTAIDNMRRASDDEIHGRLVRTLRYLAKVEEHLKNREWVGSPGVIEAELEDVQKKYPLFYGELTSGDDHPQGSFLLDLGKKYPGG